jgi:hypothetical protein
MNLRRIVGWQWLALWSALVLGAFTIVVWRAQGSGGACYQERNERPKVSASQAGKDTESYACHLISPANLPTDYLVIIGIGGVFVAISTLKSIHHQAVQVRKQTDLLRISANAAKDSADATLQNINLYISRERARLRIESVELHLVNPDRWTPADWDRAELKVILHGSTPAYVLQGWISLTVSSTKETPIAPGSPSRLDLPSMIGLDKTVTEIRCPIVETEDLLRERLALAKSRFFVHFSVSISYRDVFQKNAYWELIAQRAWQVDTCSPDGISWTEHNREDNEKEIESQ